MKRKIAIMLSTLMMLYPSVSKADIDMLSIVQDKIGEIQERLDLVLKQYTGLQIDLVKAVTDRGAFLQDLRNQAKALVIEQAMMVADNIKIGALSMPGISDKVTAGIYITPELRNTLAVRFLTRRSKKVDQFSDAIAEAEKENDLAIENLAVLFAQGIVRRKQLDDEATAKEDGTTMSSAEEPESTKTTTELIQKYMELSNKANARWIDILEKQSLQDKILSTLYASRSKIDNLSDITGNLNDNLEENLSMAVLRGNGASLLSIYNNSKYAYENIKRGHYAGALGAIAGTATDAMGKNNAILDSVVGGAYAVENAYHSAESGDWSRAVAEAGLGAGGIVGTAVDGNIGGMIASGGMLVDSVNNTASGDYYRAYGAVDDLANLLQASQNYGEERAEKAEQKAMEENKKK